MKMKDHIALAAKFEALAERFRQLHKPPDWLAGIHRQAEGLPLAVLRSVLDSVSKQQDQSTRIANLNRKKTVIFAVISKFRGRQESFILERINASLANAGFGKKAIGIHQLQRYLKQYDYEQS